MEDRERVYTGGITDKNTGEFLPFGEKVHMRELIPQGLTEHEKRNIRSFAIEQAIKTGATNPIGLAIEIERFIRNGE